MSLKRGSNDDFGGHSAKYARFEVDTIKKHSLDSDEEDADEQRKQSYDILDDDDIEGQEEGVSGQDGEVKFTPFNMKEEMEEGHFDTDGNFHWDKESSVKDNWLENIDWVKRDFHTHLKLKNDQEWQADISPFRDLTAWNFLCLCVYERPKDVFLQPCLCNQGNGVTSQKWKVQRNWTNAIEELFQILEKTAKAEKFLKTRAEEVAVLVKERSKYTEDDDLDKTFDTNSSSPFDHVAAYRQMLELMNEGETVAKALRRLGGNKSLSASERLKRKKAGLSIETNSDSGKVVELTELANKILTKTGNMNVYQESYQQIKNMINENTPKTYDDALDMYADDFDEKEKERLEKRNENNPSTSGSDVAGSNEILMWEYKLEKDSDNIQGPHTTEQMQKYVDDGVFKSEFWVRKAGENGSFYSSRRIDFQLYL